MPLIDRLWESWGRVTMFARRIAVYRKQKALRQAQGRREGRRPNSQLQIRSTIIATALPPPRHNAARPRRRLFRFKACNRVTRTRAPLAPIGWPSAIAPPWMFVLAGSSRSGRMQATQTYTEIGRAHLRTP